MKNSFIYYPTYFFCSSFIITYAVWFIAAYISYQQSLQHLLFPLILIGMSGPSIAALIMLRKSKDKNLWNNLLQRLSFNKIKIFFIPIILFFMPCVIALSITISLLFGFSADQFLLSQATLDLVLKGTNLLVVLMIIVLSCSLEEIGWRGYGIESLNSKFNLWHTSLIFATLWSLWHIPAFFIKNGYFQQEVWNLGIIHVFTYFISLFPITVLINWIYIKNHRSVLIVIISHAAMNFSYGLFQIQPFTKIILMFVLLLFAGITVKKDKKIFFNT